MGFRVFTSDGVVKVFDRLIPALQYAREHVHQNDFSAPLNGEIVGRNYHVSRWDRWADLEEV